MGFVNLGLLGVGGLIAIPILIHLLNRRRFEVVRWAAMDFLLQAERENRRKVKIEHLLVLFLRCLAILLLALLLARPTVSEQGLGFLPGVSETIERVVIVDDSGSMGYRSGRSTSFERARRITKRLIADLREQRPGDLLTVIHSSSPEQAELRLAPARSEKVEQYLPRLDRAASTQQTFDLTRCLRAALSTSKEAPGKAVIYVVTDRRHRDWLGARGDLSKQGAIALQESGRAGEGLRLLVVDVAGEGGKNLGVTALEPVEKLAMGGLPFEISVRVHNYGDKPVYEIPLTLRTPDGSVPLTPIAAIKPGESAVVRHRTTFLESGPQAISVSLGEDELPLDDERHLALRVTDAVKALLIDGEREEGALGSEAALLSMALAPPGDMLSGVEPTVVLAEDASGEDLNDYDTVILCNVERWPAERLVELERFVKRGGGLAVFLGDKVDTEAYARDLYREGEGLLPCKLGEVVKAEREELRPSLAPPQTTHALTKIFSGERNPFLSRVRAQSWRRTALHPERDATSEVVLGLSDAARTPFVIEKPYGRGRVVLFNTTADNAWSSFPKSPAWPVVGQELVRLLAPPATQGLNLTCGQPLERALDPARDRTQVGLQLLGVDKRPRELFAQQVEGQDSLRVSQPDTSRAGVYAMTLTSLKGETRKELFAANVDAAEGDLRRAQPDVIKDGFEGITVEFLEGGEETNLLRMTDGTRSEMWRTFLLVLFLVLLGEQVAAWYAAHHSAPNTGGGA